MSHPNLGHGCARAAPRARSTETRTASQSMRAKQITQPNEMALGQIPPLSAMIRVVVPWTVHNAEKAMREICELDPWSRQGLSPVFQHMSCQQKRLQSLGDHLNAMRGEEAPCRKRLKAGFEHHKRDTQFLEIGGSLQADARSYVEQFWEHWRAWRLQQIALKRAMADAVHTAELKAAGPPQAATSTAAEDTTMPSVDGMACCAPLCPPPGFTITQWDEVSRLAEAAIHKRNDAIQAVNGLKCALEELSALVLLKGEMHDAVQPINAGAQNCTAQLIALLRERERHIQQLSTVPVHNVENDRTEALQLADEAAIADARRRHELVRCTPMALMVQREQQQLQVKKEMVQEAEEDKDGEFNTMTAFSGRQADAIERLTALAKEHELPHQKIAAAAKIRTHCT